LIERMKGKVWLESAMGKGTKFIFSLAQGTPPGNDAPPL